MSLKVPEKMTLVLQKDEKTYLCIFICERAKCFTLVFLNKLLFAEKRFKKG